MGKARKRKNRLKKRIEAEINTYNSILGKAGSIVSIVPRIEELKEEAEAKLFAINRLPEDFLEELTPRLLINQDWDFQSIKRLDNSLPRIGLASVSNSTSGGTISDITATITGTFPSFESRPDWANEVITRFSEIADVQARKISLPQAIGFLSEELGEEFIRAEQSVRKVKAGIVQPHQAASSMRNVIQQVWGEFVNRARERGTENPKNMRFELKKSSHRHAICTALSTGSSLAIFEARLEQLYDMYQDLSKLSKRTGTSPIKLLHELRIRWIFALDALRPFFPQENKKAG